MKSTLKELMHLLYYGTRLSPNISRRDPEGYLFCLNVPVARTGTQEYLPEELGLPPGPGMIPVLRPEDEVFSPAALASFEGMPVTDDHPRTPDGVTAENIRYLQKGHAHNIRRGSGEFSDCLLADLIITDPALIDKVLSEEKREISCGYNYELYEENGTYIQRQIRGNHVAVVDAGRAGHRVCIKDHEPERSHKNMRKPNMKLAGVLARMAKDGQEEAVAEILAEILEPETAAETEAAAAVSAAEPAATAVPAAAVAVAPAAPAAAAPAFPAEPVSGCGAPESRGCMPEILAALNRIIALLEPAPAQDEDPADTAEAAAEAAENTAEAAGEAAEAAAEAAGAASGAAEAAAEAETAADPITELVQELVESIPEGEELSSVLEPGQDPENADCGLPDRTADAVRAAVAAVRPAIARLPAAARKQVTADLSRRLHELSGRPAGAVSDTYAALKRLSGAREETSPKELGLRIMAARNINYRK